MRAVHKERRASCFIFHSCALDDTHAIRSGGVLFRHSGRRAVADQRQQSLAPFSTAAHTDTKPALPKSACNRWRCLHRPHQIPRRLENRWWRPAGDGREAEISHCAWISNNAPLQATPGSDYSTMQNPCLLSSRCIRTKTGTPPSTQTSDSAIHRYTAAHSTRLRSLAAGPDATTPQAASWWNRAVVNWRRCMRGWATAGLEALFKDIGKRPSAGLDRDDTGRA